MNIYELVSDFLNKQTAANSARNEYDKARNELTQYAGEFPVVFVDAAGRTLLAELGSVKYNKPDLAVHDYLVFTPIVIAAPEATPAAVKMREPGAIACSMRRCNKVDYFDSITHALEKGWFLNDAVEGVRKWTCPECKKAAAEADLKKAMVSKMVDGNGG